jgi:hypothetical protein
VIGFVSTEAAASDAGAGSLMLAVGLPLLLVHGCPSYHELLTGVIRSSPPRHRPRARQGQAPELQAAGRRLAAHRPAGGLAVLAGRGRLTRGMRAWA